MKSKTKFVNNMTIVVGGHDTGITTENKKHIGKYVKDRKALCQDYKVLIIDFENEYKGIRINQEDINSFKNKTSIIGDSLMTLKQRVDLIKKVARDYNGGLLVIDDFNKSVQNTTDYIHIVSSLSTYEHKDVSVLLSVGGSFLNIQPSLWKRISYLRLHHTFENLDCKKVSRKFDYPQIYKIGMSILNFKFTNGNDKCFVTIDRNNYKILGCTRLEYLEGFESYFKKVNSKIELDFFPTI